MLVFVYGTLMANNRNHNQFMKQAEFVSTAILNDYAIYNLGTYPGIKPDQGKRVHGEIYKITPEILHKLNELEEEGSLYVIAYENIIVNDKLYENVIVYVYNLPITGYESIRECNQPWRD